MSTLKRLAATALSAAIIAAPVLTISSADAAPAKAGRSWTTIAKWSGAKQEACRVPVKGGEAFKIYTRLVNGHKAEVGAGMTVLKKDKRTKQAWRSPILAKGKTSKTGSVVLPIGPKYTLEAFQFQGQMGDGGLVNVDKIGRC
jgi:hypothetical protein